ncbi:MAG TPA: nuclear transport factor 2 family protein [Anaerolineae bacterium]|nr:nuclear transport factor 2 family protein [Anaerolineae bacterium]
MDINLETQLLDLERHFWKGDTEFYHQNLADDSLMVFAMPIGVLTKDEVIRSIALGPRWNEVHFSDVHLLRLSDRIVTLIYRARAARLGDETAYEASASSIYVNAGGAWRLAFHQQTPDDDSN